MCGINNYLVYHVYDILEAAAALSLIVHMSETPSLLPACQIASGSIECKVAKTLKPLGKETNWIHGSNGNFVRTDMARHTMLVTAQYHTMYSTVYSDYLVVFVYIP